MKKSVAALLIFLLIFSLGMTQVYAVEPSGEEYGGAGDDGNHDDGILTPDSPFYFLKRFFEGLRQLLTFDQEKKADLLEELTEERLKELEALNSQYEDEELTEEELELLEQALDDLILYLEKFVAALGEDEPQVAGDDDEGMENGDDPDGKGEEQAFADKYLWRIAHLESIMKRVPLSAHSGLSRAIANAQRQRERAIARGKIIVDESEETAHDDTQISIVISQNNGDGDSENGVENEEEDPEDKYMWRISHLTTLMEQSPAGAKFGLSRAIANAERQREKAIAKGKLNGEESLGEPGESEGEGLTQSKEKKVKPPKPAKPGKKGGAAKF